MFKTLEANAKQFRVIDDTLAGVLAVYDWRPGYNIYAPIVAHNGQAVLDGSAARTYFDDELEEIR